jgi:hypothetical protein
MRTTPLGPLYAKESRRLRRLLSWTRESATISNRDTTPGGVDKVDKNRPLRPGKPLQ